MSLVMLAAACAGCGGSKAEKKDDAGPARKLYGKVTFKGKDLGVGDVIALGPGGRIARSTIGADGTYLIENAPAGEVQLYLELPPPLPGYDPISGRPLAADAPPPEMPKEELEARKLAMQVPERYTQRVRPPFKTRVEEDKINVFDLKLTR